MKATVHRVSPEGNVALVSDYGLVSGAWPGEMPALGRRVEVELDYDQIVAIHRSESSAPRLESNGDTAVLVGMLEKDAEGSPYLRVAQDIVLLDDVAREQPAGWVQVSVTGLKFFDKNV